MVDVLGTDTAVDAVQRRGLVPTPRQVEDGTHHEHYTYVPPAPRKRHRRSPIQFVGAWAKDADPRLLDGPKLPIVVLAIGAMFGAWDDIALSVLLPEIRADFGLSLAFLAALGTQLAVVTTLIAPLMGYLADRIKRVWMVRFGAILANVSSIGAGLAPGAPQLMGTRMAAGVAKGVNDPAAFPLLTDYYPSRVRARVFAFLFAAGAFGTVIGPTVAGRLGDAFGWRSTLIVLGLLATVVSVGTFFMREPKRGGVDRAEAGITEDESAEQPPVSFAEGWRAARSISTVRKFWIASPILYVGGAGAALLLSVYFAEVFYLGPRERGYLGTAGGVMGLIALIVSGPVTDRLLRDRPGRVLTVLGFVLLLQAGCFALLSFSPWLWLSIAASLLIGFVSALLVPAFLTLLSLVVPARVRAFGLQSIGWFTLIGIIAFPRVVALSDSFGLRRGILFFVPFVAAGGLVVMSAATGVERDIRAARAASIAGDAAAQSRRNRRNKLLVCRDIDVTYGGAQVLFNVDFDVEEAEIVAVLGTNGAGKSTLLRAIAGVHEPSNGAIFFDGRDITHAPPHETAAFGIVMMPGGAATFPTLTVEENLRTAGWLYQSDGDEVDRRVQDVLDLFPALRARLGEMAGNLSGGEQQMVGLSQALIMRPRLLLIDELSLGLAPAIIEQLLDVLRRIHAQGTTIVIVEQSVNVALTIAQRSVFMEKGEIHFDGPTAELLVRPELVRAVFMGDAAVGGTASTRRRRLASASTEQAHAVALQVGDVSVRFGGVHALTGVSLDVGMGEVVGIIGPNGAGKTTLFDVISGFTTPATGSVHIDEQDVTAFSADARAQLGLSRSFQRALLFPSLTVRENIAVALERQAARNPVLAAVWAPGLRRNEQRLFRRVDGLIELLGLDAFADKFVSELSTGSRRAVDVACVMAAEPKILLLDEPSTGLAQAEAEELGPVISRLVKQTGCGVLVIEHDLPLITSVSDRLIAMELGIVIASGTPAETTSNPKVLASYLSASDAVLHRSDAGGALVPAREDAISLQQKERS